MRKRILSFILAASMLVPSMSVMAAEVQTDFSQVSEVQEVEEEVVGTTVAEGMARAEAAEANVAIAGEISVEYEMDWYKFTSVDDTNYYTFTLQNVGINSGSSFNRGNMEVYDKDGVLIASVENVDVSKAKSIDIKLEKNTEYFIKIYAYKTRVGAYSFNFVPHADEADVKEDARSVEAQNTHESTIDVAYDADWYKFTSVDYTNYYTFTLKNVSIDSGTSYNEVNLEIYDGNNKIASIEGVKEYSEKQTDVKLDKNKTYYIKVYAQTTKIGGYSFDFVPHAEEADVKEDAKTVEAQKEHKSIIDVDGDADWYKFTSVDYNNYYTFKFQNISIDNGNTAKEAYLEVYDDKDVKVVSIEKVGAYTEESVNVKLDKNKTYYIKVYAHIYKIGEYSFEFVPYVDEADTKEEAQKVVKGVANKATISAPGDTDWYKFTTNNGDAEYEFSFANESVGHAVMELYDKNGTKVKDTGKVAKGKEAEFKASLDKNSDYFVKVSGVNNGEGAYNFTVDAVTDWPFGDVAENPGNWKYEAVNYVYENGIMNGVGSGSFQPDAPLTRGMFATMLYRMCGQPAVGFTNKFDDVPAGQWYSNAIIWASNQGIVNGYGNGRFGTNDNITREQIAKMLNEYGKYQAYDVNQDADFSSFTDASNVSGWANNYMRWAVGSGMIGGKPVDGKLCLEPKASATRAESATMLKRFMEKYN